MNSTDAFIEACHQLKSQIRQLNQAMETCSQKSITGPYLFRPIYAEEFRNLARLTKEDESLFLELAQALEKIITKAPKTDLVSFSQAQIGQIREFLEMAKRPLFPCLGEDAKYSHPWINSGTACWDC